MRMVSGICSLLIAVVLLAGSTLNGQSVPELNVAVVTGGHDYETSFYRVFEQPGIRWDHFVSNEAAFARDLRKYDVVVLYDMSKDLGPKGRANAQAFAESGKGLVVMHHAIVDYATTWPWWYQELVGGRYLEQPDGNQPASSYKHDEELQIEPAMNHPIVDSLGRFRITDETYKGMWISPKVKVLLKTDNPTSDGPVAWISPWPKARVVYIQLGHDRKAHDNPAFRKLVRNTIVWSAGK